MNNIVNLVSNHGDRFTYYESDEFCIGKGAMGEVFKGWYTHNPEHKVAIKKVYARHAEHPMIRERARYESSLSIDHPNLIKMLGYCQFNPMRGPIWIVSELVRGVTIDIFATSLDPHIRVEVVSRMICSALDALTCLHTLNPPIYHRDVKPSNIMVENGNNIRLMDLGIAKSDGVNFGTLPGRAFGTYEYAPPEQVLGQRDAVNATSDIYSMAETFYVLLTGNNPFRGGSDVDIMDRQIKMRLPYNEIIPKRLFNVITKGAAKQQVDRYQTAVEFKDAIIQASIPESPKIKWWMAASVIVLVAIFLIMILL